ncbi:hypothetical protein LCGC14_0990260 [marine sediment metagenome]|uniref:Uncharacterized protein n=1 Tax=marine sediment metagenome TaxID=412755 RepID=A0A0F9NAL3_9ZZZZ
MFDYYPKGSVIDHSRPRFLALMSHTQAGAALFLEVIMVSVTIGQDTYTDRSIDVAVAEVWCSYRHKDVDIIGVEGCLPESGACGFLSTVKPGVIVCKWTEADGGAQKQDQAFGQSLSK